MLRVDLRDLRRGPVNVEAEVSPDDPLLQGLPVVLRGPVEVEGQVQESGGEGEYLWRGVLHTVVDASCRRCLADVAQDLDISVDVLFSTDPDAADDPSVYPLAASAQVLELGDVVREELMLAVPEFVLCRPDCAGLCATCGADLNAGSCQCLASAETV